MSSVQLNGITISYDVLGEGPPIVLIHGYASNRKVNWEGNGWYEYFLLKGRRVIAPDIRGHGESQRLYGIDDYTPDVISTDILALMDHLEISKADIMGYSMGAWLAVYFLGAHPERFASGVLGGIGRGILSYKTHSKYIAQAFTAEDPDSITDPFLKSIRTFAEGLGNDLSALAACNIGVNGQDAPHLDKIHHPILIVSGEKDDVAGPPDILVDSINNATLARIPEKDHITMLSATLFKHEVGKFLKNNKQITFP